MILHLTLLLLFQLAGEITARALSLPVPGPVIGLAALVLAFLASPRLARAMQPTANGLLAHLSLLFVPAGVGVVGHLGLLGAQGGQLLLTLIGSTVLAIAAGAGVFVWVQRLTGGGE